MYLSEDKPQTSAPSISLICAFNWGMSVVVIGLIGLIVFEAIRLTHKPDRHFQKFIEVADFSSYEKCLKNKGGNGCSKYLVSEWEKIYGE